MLKYRKTEFCIKNISLNSKFNFELNSELNFELNLEKVFKKRVINRRSVQVTYSINYNRYSLKIKIFSIIHTLYTNLKKRI